MPKAQKPVFPSEISWLSDHISVQCKDGRVFYFNALCPINLHSADDIKGFYHVVCLLYDLGLCKQAQISSFFKVSTISVKRAYKEFQITGTSGLKNEKKKANANPQFLPPQ